MTEQLMTAATIFLALFALVAAVDGLYFHLWKYRLYSRPESVYEHKLHTVRAFLFVPIVFFLFYQNYGGAALWIGVFFIVLDTVIELIDVLDEKDARAALGGLSSIEYAAHVLATTLRTAFIVLALAAKPLSAWSFSSTLILEQAFSMGTLAALSVIPGNLLIAILHLVLMQSKYRIKTGRMLPIRICCRRNRQIRN